MTRYLGTEPEFEEPIRQTKPIPPNRPTVRSAISKQIPRHKLSKWRTTPSPLLSIRRSHSTYIRPTTSNPPQPHPNPPNTPCPPSPHPHPSHHTSPTPQNSLPLPLSPLLLLPLHLRHAPRPRRPDNRFFIYPRHLNYAPQC